jgi:hypothetical protein
MPMFKNSSGEEVNVIWVDGLFKIADETFTNLTEVNAYLAALNDNPQYLK